MAKADSLSWDDQVTLDRLAKTAEHVREQLGKVIIGQHDASELILISMLAGGHSLLIGVPGLAKTLMVRTFSQILDVEFSRIQFTPDLMPSDVTGTDVLVQDANTGERSFRFIKGPIFANILLADEINRAPPKTQSALLEAMQEHQVTIGSARHLLPDPFMVLATQNPIEQEGTYPLPEAQLDRFMFVINLEYPEEQDELQMLLRTTGEESEKVEAILHAEQIIQFRAMIRRLVISESLAATALQIVRCTRPSKDNPLLDVQEYIAYGAGPRAGQFLILAAKALAALRGSPLVTEEDLFRVITPVLSHRIKTNFTAQARGVTVASVIESIAKYVKENLQSKAHRSGIASVLRS